METNSFHKSKIQNFISSFLGKKLFGENKIFFENGFLYQKNAIQSMKNGDILDYYFKIRRASEEYQKINI